MRRGDIYWVDFPAGPPGAVGGEVRKPRPAVIVSATEANLRLNRVTVVPLTSQRVDTLFPGESAVDATSTGHVPSKALATQLRTVAKERVRRLLGALTRPERDALDAAIRTHLAL